MFSASGLASIWVLIGVLRVFLRDLRVKIISNAEVAEEDASTLESIYAKISLILLYTRLIQTI